MTLLPNLRSDVVNDLHRVRLLSVLDHRGVLLDHPATFRFQLIRETTPKVVLVFLALGRGALLAGLAPGMGGQGFGKNSWPRKPSILCIQRYLKIYFFNPAKGIAFDVQFSDY